MFPRRVSPRLVSQSGAAAGAGLGGAGPGNQGLRLRALLEQRAGHHGGILGQFVLLDAGDNKHSDALRPLLRRLTTAEEVLAAIRLRSPGCVSVSNANALELE